MPDVTNEQVEAFFRSATLKFRTHPERQDVWELTFRMKTSAFTIFIDNGVLNPRFLTVSLIYLRPQANHQRVYQQLLRKTGNILFSKFVLDKQDNICIRATVLRDERFSPLEKLKHVIGAVLQPADQWYVEMLNLATATPKSLEEVIGKT